jgi:hypothetical protein
VESTKSFEDGIAEVVHFLNISRNVIAVADKSLYTLTFNIIRLVSLVLVFESIRSYGIKENHLHEGCDSAHACVLYVE